MPWPMGREVMTINPLGPFYIINYSCSQLMVRHSYHYKSRAKKLSGGIGGKSR